jgi:hypothetical protein
VAGTDKQEFAALLPAGFHPMDLAGLRRLTVDRFPYSFTRHSIMTSFESIVARINQSGIAGQIWIDGSFLTEKPEPEDVDMVLAIDVATFRSLDAAQQRFFLGFQAASLFASHKCDNYAIIIDPSRPDSAWLYAYWLRQFGFSRADEMKGIVTINVPFLVTP